MGVELDIGRYLWPNIAEGRQPQVAALPLASLRPLAGVQPGGFDLKDTAGPALAVGAGITRIAGAIKFTASGMLSRAVSASYPLTLVWRGTVASSGIQAMTSIANTSDHFARIYAFNGDVAAQHNASTTSATATAAASFQYGKTFTVVAVFASSTDCRVYVSGRRSASSSTDVGTFGALNKLSFGGYDGSSVAYLQDGTTEMCQWLNVALNDAQAWDFVGNPWQIYAQPTTSIWPAAAAAGGNIVGSSSQQLTLAGSATGAVAITGASSAQIAFSGAAAGALTIVGASAATVVMTGTASATAAATGASAATVTLTGSATGTTSGVVTGASAQELPITGSGTAALSIAAASSQQILMTGAGTASLVIVGASSQQITMTGSATGGDPSAVVAQVPVGGYPNKKRRNNNSLPQSKLTRKLTTFDDLQSELQHMQDLKRRKRQRAEEELLLMY